MIQKTDLIVKSAIYLTRQGFAVFPCKPKGKTPATAHGCKDASTDPAVVENMFSGNPDFNIGIATGAASGIFVVDLDGEEGVRSFADLTAKNGALPATPHVRTGNGQQIYFKLNGEPVRNRTKIDGLSIDCRGDGGYVVCPPSIHPSGRPYTWIVDLVTPLAEPPGWIVDLVVKKDTSLTSLPPGKLSFAIGGGADRPCRVGRDHHCGLSTHGESVECALNGHRTIHTRRVRGG